MYNETNSFKATETGPVTASETPVIEVLVRVLEKEQAELIEVIGVLEARLSGVLKQKQDDRKQRVDGIKAESPLAQTLAGRIADISQLTQRVSGIISRLEA